MPTIKTVTQRLFGRTVIDSLDLNQNAWYIDEEQVTATAANLNGTSILPATSQTVDVANDDVLFLDHSGSHAMAYDSIADLMTATAGTGLGAAAGVLSVDLNELSAVLLDVADSIPFIDASDNSTKKTTIANMATTMSGTGIISAAGTFNAKLEGNLAGGAVKFGAKGDTTKLTIGGIDFAYAAVPVVTNGEWTYGADAAASATSLAAGINGDTRNAGASYYRAIVDVDGDTVRIFTKTVGVPAPATIVRADGAQPATLENLAGGVGATVRKSCMVTHTVTALDVDTTVDLDIPLPLAPSMFTVQVRKSTGEINYVTDLFTVGTLPNRIHVATNGATHVAAGDVITINAQE